MANKGIYAEEALLLLVKDLGLALGAAEAKLNYSHHNRSLIELAELTQTKGGVGRLCKHYAHPNDEEKIPVTSSGEPQTKVERNVLS